MSDARLRSQLADYSQRLHARGWVANHDGNLSTRLPDGRFLATPTAFSKREVTAESLVVVDEKGAVVAGKHRVFSEMTLHLAIYAARRDVMAVVHAHPPHATALGAAGCSLDPFLPEAVVSIGPHIPLVPLSAPGPAAVEALKPLLPLYDVVMVAGNGVFAWGDSVEQAYLRLELCEHLCRIQLAAQPVGGVRPLPAALLPALLDARRRAGLGPQARGVSLPSAAETPPARLPEDKLAEIIRQELAHALRRA